MSHIVWNLQALNILTHADIESEGAPLLRHWDWRGASNQALSLKGRLYPYIESEGAPSSTQALSLKGRLYTGFESEGAPLPRL